MSLVQLLRQIQTLLQAARWPGGTASLIFGSSVYVTLGIDRDNIPGAESFPVCFIAAGSQTPENEFVAQVEAEVLIHVLCMVEGDPMGEQALIGGPREGVGDSRGKGVLEVSRAALAAVEGLTGADGTPVVVHYAAMPNVAPVEEDLNVVSATHLLKASITRVDDFPAPQRLVVAQGASGHATVSWANPYARFDYRHTVIVRKAGATPPASITDGTEIVRTAGLLTTFDDVAGVGSWSWAAFATYTYSGIAQDEFVSDAGVVGTTRSKVLT